MGMLISLPACSVNRSKYSEPEDTLIDVQGADDYWILYWVARDAILYVDAQNAGETAIETRLSHKPEPENYSHSEIETVLSGNTTPKDGSKTQRALLRSYLADRLAVYREPVNKRF